MEEELFFLWQGKKHPVLNKFYQLLDKYTANFASECLYLLKPTQRKFGFIKQSDTFW